MGVKSLNIEFEDEEELKRKEAEKKKREVQVCQQADLEFEVTSIVQNPLEGGSEDPNSSSASPGSSSGGAAGTAYSFGAELSQVISTNPVIGIEIESKIKIEANKESSKVMAEYHAQAKLLEFRANKIITQLHQKAPALKKELLMLKKLIGQYAALEERIEKGPKKASSARTGQKTKAVPKKAA